MIPIGMKRLPHAEDLPLPQYQSEGASGMDVRAAVSETMRVEPGQIALVSTGICLSIPPGFEGQVRPRSGLALKHGICLLNSPGTIDSDYRGEIKIILINLGQENFIIENGARIAQLIIAPVAKANFIRNQDLDDTGRSQGGFGSTGI